MRKIFIFSLLISIVLIGCSNDDAYNNAIEKGLDYIASEEYLKAESAFELALEEKQDDEKAANLLDQTVFYQEAEEAFKDADFELAEEKSKEVIKLEDSSSALVSKSEEILDSINEFKSTLKDVESDYKEASKQYEDKNYKEASKMTEEILSKDLKHSFFESIVKDTKELQEDIKTAQAEKEKADADKEKADADKKKADADKKEKAEKEEVAQENKEDNAQGEGDYINTVSPHNKDKEILEMRGYAVYIEDGMEFDAETDEAVLSKHPMYHEENLDAALTSIDQIYEEGMSKSDVKEELLHTVEITEEIINEAIEMFFESI